MSEPAFDGLDQAANRHHRFQLEQLPAVPGLKGWLAATGVRALQRTGHCVGDRYRLTAMPFFANEVPFLARRHMAAKAVLVEAVVHIGKAALVNFRAIFRVKNTLEIRQE